MISEVIENNRDFLNKEFQKDFNIEAKKQNIKFKVDYYNNRIILQKKGWSISGSWDIRFSKKRDAFCFIEPIEEKVFEEIESILFIIPEKFVVEIIKDRRKNEADNYL